MLAEIQCLPNPPGTNDDQYLHINNAIDVIASSGLTYEVGALGTTIQGTSDEIWNICRLVHEATINSGSDSVVTVIKIAETDDNHSEFTIESLVGDYRE